jgi:hypothetical protein
MRSSNSLIDFHEPDDSRLRHPKRDVLLAVFAAVKFLGNAQEMEVAAVVEDHADLFSDT